MSGSFCDFIFQHCYGSKWISYSDNDIELLNKALRRNQKTVKLPSKNPKKQIVVNFETMLQKNTVSSLEQRVRVLIYTDDFHAWMWLDDDEEYSSFKPHLVYYIEAAYQQKLSKIKIYDFGDYTIDLKTFKKVDEETHMSRSVARHSADLIYTTLVEEIALQSSVLLDQMRTNESVRLLCKKQRIFDPSMSTIATPSKSKKPRLSSNLFPDADESVTENFPDLCNSSVDKECPDSDDYKVYSAGELFYGATLSSTSIESNTNKYFIIQVLTKDKKYFLWQRWGRIGYKPQSDLATFGTNITNAKNEFENKFYEKTKNEWKDVLNFKQVPGKYNLLKMDLSPEIQKESGDVISKLPIQVQDLLSLITSRKMMTQIMEEMAYDFKRAPLGKLTVAQIKDGYSSLDKIAKVIAGGGSGKDIITACDEFYSKIPHNFGRKKPPVIQTYEDVEEKLKMLEALLNINIAVSIFNEVIDISDHPLDRYYKSLGCILTPLEPTSSEFEVIQKSLFSTCGPTHTKYEMEIIHIFSCQKPIEDVSYADFNNKYLLWHGSRMSNWIGILKEGLRIAPAEAPSAGAMFGKGLYFADASTKSANYCFANENQNMGLLLLCEVCLGNALELCHEVVNMPYVLPKGYQSVMGRGNYDTKGFQEGVLPCQARIPVGPLKINTDVNSSLFYNEYVVYNTKQVKMKYLLLVKFHFQTSV